MQLQYDSLATLALTWVSICHLAASNAQDLRAILTDPSIEWASTTTISSPNSQESQNGLAIDLSQLDSVDIDQDVETLTVGGGGRVSQIFDPVYNAGFEPSLYPLNPILLILIFVETINSHCPGMVGSTLGAGVGRDEGRYGLVIDALLSVRLVTADARLIEASAPLMLISFGLFEALERILASLHRPRIDYTRSPIPTTTTAKSQALL
ncbi:hypothetical protein F4810DRAFT_717655 [Camillea tinctor]|nr:hypothetical protein F4810DRAFT_717655 [Camillea tinctor]